MSARPIAACLAVSAVITGLVFCGGFVGLFMLAVVLNGFTEAQAIPWFVAWIGAVAVVNFALLLRFNGRLLAQSSAVEPSRRTLLNFAFAATYTALPFLLFGAYLAYLRLRYA